MIELMIVVAILAILAAIALPSYRQTMQSNRTATEANDFVTAIDVARTEAMTRSRPVTLCPSANGASCAGVTDWSTSKWIVFTDYGVRGTVDAGDAILRVWPQINSQDTMAPRTAGQGIQWISFDRSGSGSTDVSGAAVAFKLRPQSCAGGQVQRVIEVNLLGRASVTSGGCT